MANFRDFWISAGLHPFIARAALERRVIYRGYTRNAIGSAQFSSPPVCTCIFPPGRAYAFAVSRTSHYVYACAHSRRCTQNKLHETSSETLCILAMNNFGLIHRSRPIAAIVTKLNTADRAILNATFTSTRIRHWHYSKLRNYLTPQV